MKAKDLKKRYIEFFKSKNHKEIKNSSLIPENDPTVLFTTAGMHPLVSFLMGEKHPQGKRLVNVQRCIRTGDIDEVGDGIHFSFFEMLGNWSLGDYFKKETIEWSFEFLTKILGFPVEKLAVSVFKGDKETPKDEESFRIWLELGIPKEKIALLGKEDNWWPAGGKLPGPQGPDTEMFYWIGKKVPKKFNPKDSRWVEVWNDVFMEYSKTEEGELIKLKNQNVDTGFGFERVVAILESKENAYETYLFKGIVDKIKILGGLKRLNSNQDRSVKIIADHLRAAVFILGDENGIVPSNLDRGYVLRRLIRGAIRHGRLIGIEKQFTSLVAKVVINIYRKDYPLLEKKKDFVLEELRKEEEKFSLTLTKGLKEFNKLKGNISGKEAFLLFQSFGFPLEMTEELAKGRKVDVKGFEKEFFKHQELSRTSTKGMFGSGLADHSEETTKLHTATHLLLAALRKVLSSGIEQRGSNITKERLRFDFNFDRKLENSEIKKVEDQVNEWIKEGVEVVKEEMTIEEAKKKGATGIFEYDGEVSVYTISKVSKEICSGPHVKNISLLGKFKIKKEQSSSAGVRRIKAVLE